MGFQPEVQGCPWTRICKHAADSAEAPAARDLYDAAPLVTALRGPAARAVGRQLSTKAGGLDAARAGASGLMMLCHLPLLGASQVGSLGDGEWGGGGRVTAKMQRIVAIHLLGPPPGVYAGPLSHGVTA